MKLRKAGALAVLISGGGWLTAQGQIPTALTPPVLGSAVSPPPVLGSAVPPPPFLGSAVPPPGSAGNFPNAPSLPGEAFWANNGNNHYYGGADYLVWKIRGYDLPDTITSVPIGLVQVTQQVRVISPTPTPVPPPRTVFVPISVVTKASFGGPSSTDPGFVNGTRLTLGYWCDDNHGIGIESQTIIMARGIDNRSVSNAASPSSVLLNTGVNDQIFVICAGSDRVNPAAGGSTIVITDGTPTMVSNNPVTIPRNAASTVSLTSSNSLFGTELNVRSTTLKIGAADFGTLVGFRYVAFTDRLTASSNVTLTQPTDVTPPASDTLSRNLTFSTVDQVRVWNNFVGAQIGFDSEVHFGSMFLAGRLKLAVGPNFQSANTSGTAVLINNDSERPLPASRVTTGGLLVGPTDQGDHDRTRYSFIPELNLKLGCQIAPWARVTVGYDGLYLGHMARSGLSSTTNTLTVSTASGSSNSSSTIVTPAFRFADHDAWVQGLSFGFELMF